MLLLHPIPPLSPRDGARLKAEKRLLAGPGEGGRGKSWETDEAEEGLGKGEKEKRVGGRGHSSEGAEWPAFLSCQHCLLWVFGVSGWGEVCAGGEGFEALARRMWGGRGVASGTLVHTCTRAHFILWSQPEA